MDNEFDDLPKCPKPDCGQILNEDWQNVGFTAPDPEYWQVEGYSCPVHGEVEPAGRPNND